MMAKPSISFWTAPLADRLQEATDQFEQTHPRLTLAIGAVAEALSRLGI